MTPIKSWMKGTRTSKNAQKNRLTIGENHFILVSCYLLLYCQGYKVTDLILF